MLFPNAYQKVAWLVAAGLIVLVILSIEVSFIRDVPVSLSFKWVRKASDAQHQVGDSFWAQRPPHYPLTKLSALPTPASLSVGPAVPTGLPAVQATFSVETDEQRLTRLDRRQKVKDVFNRCWSSYRRRAWLHDELQPISGGSNDPLGGWAATLIDSLDTLWIMDMRDEFNSAIRDLHYINFTTSTSDVVNIFETTIRHLGGLLSAYDLSVEDVILSKAIELGEMLLVPFDTPNHMPITPELGSLGLEFTRLSQITNDTRWYTLALDVSSELHDVQLRSETRMSGLFPIIVNPRDRNYSSDNTFTLGAMSDSVYEYMPKMHQVTDGLDVRYDQMYHAATAAIIQNMLFRPMTPTNLDILLSGDLHVRDNGALSLTPRHQHLTCFAGGMFALASKLWPDSASHHLDIARKLTDGCIWAYNAMPWGVMPEVAWYLPCNNSSILNNTGDDCNWDRQAWLAEVARLDGTDVSIAEATVKRKGLVEGITDFEDRQYLLRPEALESAFVMYRITGDRAYQEHAWRTFEAIERISSVEFGNAEVRDVSVPQKTDREGLDWGDRQQSYFFAETLKYAYLVLSDEGETSLDDWVFNTEGHPLRRPR